MKEKYRIEFESIANRLERIYKCFFDSDMVKEIYILEKDIREYLLKKSKSYKQNFHNKCNIIFSFHNFRILTNQIIK